MAWALVKKSGEIFRSHKRKYDLLKWEVETKERISKKTIKNLHDGDTITVVFRKSYRKWFINPNGRHYQDTVNEVNERQYILKEIETTFKKPIHV